MPLADMRTLVYQNLIDLFFVRKADTVSDGIFFNDVKERLTLFFA